MQTSVRTDPESLRVAVIGAGPAGLSFARHLREAGVREITVFDGAAEVGGQSVTVDVDGVAIELGTCYLSSGYQMAGSIAEDLGCTLDLLPPATLVDEKGREAPRRDLSSVLVMRYVAKWLRWYARGQMYRPSDPENALPFDQWLRRNGLGELATDFTFSAGLTAQLYGPIESITAHSGLTWMRPSLFVTGRLSRTKAIREGFQTLWRRLADHLALDLRLGQAVAAVVATPDGPSVDLESGERETFDLVYIGCPLDELTHPLSAALDGHSAFEHSAVYSAIWRGSGWPGFAPSRCYLPASVRGELGRLLTVRRFAEDEGGRAVGAMVAYADPTRSLEEHRRQALADLHDGLGMHDTSVVQDRLWRYNVRYHPDQIREGVPALIDQAQGEGGVWYGGGALSHWNVDSITDSNYVLVRRLARDLGFGFQRRLGLWRRDRLWRDL